MDEKIQFFLIYFESIIAYKCFIEVFFKIQNFSSGIYFCALLFAQVIFGDE